MTTTIKERDIDDMLNRLVLNTGLELSMEHRAGGYTVYLMKGASVLELVAFAQSRGEIYRQILAANRVIEILDKVGTVTAERRQVKH